MPVAPVIYIFQEAGNEPESWIAMPSKRTRASNRFGFKVRVS
jgi:hypothetical protein